MSEGGGCEATVTAWADIKEGHELLFERRFPLMLNRAAYKCFSEPAILYGCVKYGV